MPFLGILGQPRTGKTLLATIITVQLYRINQLNKTPFYVYANYHFLAEMERIVVYIDKPQTYLNVKTPELGQGLAIFDEMWTWAMAKGSGTGIVQKFMQQVIFQSGKRGFGDIIWTAQRAKTVAPDVRNLTTKFFKTRSPTDEYYRYNYVSDTYYEGKKVLPLRISKAKANPYYNFYDTREIIRTINPEDLKEPADNPELLPLTDVAEIDDNLTSEDKNEIQTIEQRLEDTLANSQQNKEEVEVKRTIIPMDLGLQNIMRKKK